MITIVEEKDAKFITHAGSFHADDVMATVLLEIFKGNCFFFNLYFCAELLS